MNWYITYFYNIRFFPKNLTPVSTAVWDPKWFHDNKGKDYIFYDKNGVINGINCIGLSPAAANATEQCKDCSKELQGNCEFIQKYRDYIFSLDFKEVTALIRDNIYKVNPGCDICLMVYEKPDNPCSERGVLQEWFKANGIELKEWTRGL